MRIGHGDWEIRVHELPDYEFVYTSIEWPDLGEDFEEDFADPGSSYEHRPGLAEAAGGMIRIRQNGKFGFCDCYGLPAVPCAYDYAGQFASGICTVGIAGKYGIVDRSGQEIVPLVHRKLVKLYDLYNADRAFVLRRKYLLDVGGAAEELDIPRYPYTYEGPRCLLELDALADYRPETFWKDSDKLLIGHKGRCGIIDNKGQVCAPLIYDSIHRHGVASRDGQLSLLDAEGREILPSGGYDRIRKMSIGGNIAAENRGDFILAGKNGEADRVITKNGLLICVMPKRRYTSRDVIARITASCLAGRLDENHCLIRAEGKYGVIQTGGCNGFEQDGQYRGGIAEILPFIWDDPKACAAEYRRLLAETPEPGTLSVEEMWGEDPSAGDTPDPAVPDCAAPGFERLVGPFARTPQGVQNVESEEIVLSKAYSYFMPAWGMNTESYHAFTASKNGRWYFVELRERAREVLR